MRTEPKASYRMVQYEYAYRYTPNKNVLHQFRKSKATPYLSSLVKPNSFEKFKNKIKILFNLFIFFTHWRS